MGLATFRQGGSSSNGGAILYHMKPLILSSQLYGMGTTNSSSVPVWRSGASDKSFSATSTTGITLYTTASTGVRSSVAAITYTTYLASSNGIAFHLNSTDTCLYALLNAGTSYQLIKISDTTGVVTAIGSSFVPTTDANWNGGGTLSIDAGSGYLKYTSNGFYHLLNKTTGAIVSQNTAVSLGSYLARNVFYCTQDGSVGVSPDLGCTTFVTGLYYFPNLVSSSYGHIPSMALPSASAGNLTVSSSPYPLYKPSIVLVDTDKVLISTALIDTSQAIGAKYYTLTDFDKFIKSVADVGAGVI